MRKKTAKDELPKCPHNPGGVECISADTPACGWHPKEAKRRKLLIEENGLQVVSLGHRFPRAEQREVKQDE